MPSGKKAKPGAESQAISEILRGYRGVREMNNAEISRKTGLPESTISRLLRSEKEFDLNQLRLICNALGLSMSKVMAAAEHITIGQQTGENGQPGEGDIVRFLTLGNVHTHQQ